MQYFEMFTGFNSTICKGLLCSEYLDQMLYTFLQKSNYLRFSALASHPNVINRTMIQELLYAQEIFVQRQNQEAFENYYEDVVAKMNFTAIFQTYLEATSNCYEQDVNDFITCMNNLFEFHSFRCDGISIISKNY